MVDLPFEEDSPSSDDAPRGINLKKAAIIAASVAGVALLGSGVVYGPTVVRVMQQSDTAVSTPTQVGGLAIFSTDDAANVADTFRGAVSSAVKLDKSVGAIYKDTAGSVFVVAGTGRIWKPEDSLKSAFNVVADQDGGVRDVRDVHAGDLGGTMRCGVTATPEGDLAVCGWADNGSVGVAMFPSRPVDKAAPLMLELRNAIEQRS